MRCAALVRPLVPAPRPSIAGAVSDLMSVRKPCSLAVPTVVGVSAAISDSATNARINWRCPLPLRKLAFSLVQTEFIGTRFLRRKIVGRCCNPVNHRGLHRPENGRGADGALDNRLVPNPVASIAGVAYWQKCLRSGSALPARANVAIDRPDADRTDALAAHDLGRSFRPLSLLNSGLIPQVPFPQFLFTALGYDQYRPVRRLLSFRIYLPGVSLFLLL